MDAQQTEKAKAELLRMSRAWRRREAGVRTDEGGVCVPSGAYCWHRETQGIAFRDRLGKQIVADMYAAAAQGRRGAEEITQDAVTRALSEGGKDALGGEPLRAMIEQEGRHIELVLGGWLPGMDAQ